MQVARLSFAVGPRRAAALQTRSKRDVNGLCVVPNAMVMAFSPPVRKQMLQGGDVILIGEDAHMVGRGFPENLLLRGKQPVPPLEIGRLETGGGGVHQGNFICPDEWSEVGTLCHCILHEILRF